MYILKRPTKIYYSFGFENDIIDIWRDAVPTYKHRVTVWCIRNIICIGVMSCYGIVSPYPLRLWLQNRLLNRFGFYPIVTNIRPWSGLGSHINMLLWLQHNQVFYVPVSAGIWGAWYMDHSSCELTSKCKLLYSVKDDAACCCHCVLSPCFV